MLYAEDLVWKNNPFSLPFSDTMGSGAGLDSNAFGLANQNLTIQGIWQIGNIYKAMISDTIISIGSEIDGYLVQRIEANKVLLRSMKTGSMEILEVKN